MQARLWAGARIMIIGAANINCPECSPGRALRLTACGDGSELPLRSIFVRQNTASELGRFSQTCGCTWHPTDWETLCWRARRGTMPAREYVELRIQNLAIHNWDIRAAFEPAPRLAPESMPSWSTWRPPGSG
jgi:hypothetical protein